jgi:gag-polyprotein putative aspartyl protease
MPPRRIRAVVVHEQFHYRVVRPARPGSALPPPQPPKRGNGGGWLVAGGVIGALVVIGKLAGGDASPVAPSIHETGRRVLVTSKIDGDRCLAPGFSVNGVPITFMVDTGAPDVEFPNSWAAKFGLMNLEYRELWPGTRYGKIATGTVHEIRVRDVVWKDQEARFYSNWAYSFGDDTRPLLGLGALNARGVHVEFEGDTCRLTVAK